MIKDRTESNPNPAQINQASTDIFDPLELFPIYQCVEQQQQQSENTQEDNCDNQISYQLRVEGEEKKNNIIRYRAKYEIEIEWIIVPWIYVEFQFYYFPQYNNFKRLKMIKFNNKQYHHNILRYTLATSSFSFQFISYYLLGLQQKQNKIISSIQEKQNKHKSQKNNNLLKLKE